MKEPDDRSRRHSCRELVDLLCDFLEGDLEPEEGEELERHMADCPPCLAFLNTYQKTSELCCKLRAEDIPPELKERLARFLEDSRKKRK